LAAAPKSAPAKPAAKEVTAKPAAKAAPAEAAPEGGAEGPSLWEESDLLKYNEWTVKLQGLINLNIKNRHYSIFKPNTKDPIGVADEKASGLILALRAFKFDKWLPTKVEVRETADGPLILAIRKAVTPFMPWSTVEIYDDQAQKIAYFKTKIFSLLGGFWLYDAEGKEVAEVKAKIGIPPRYNFLSKDGRELGSITTDALAKTTGPEKKKFAVEFGRPGLRLKVAPEMASQPRVKVLMLATALAMEFTGVAERFLMK
jgi:hypothetical protein